MQQLSLSLNLPTQMTLETFYAAQHQQVLRHLKKIARGNDSYLYLHGSLGVGKTHLLIGACHWARRYERTACYLSLRALTDVAALADLERVNLVCLDDLDAIAGNMIWEEAIFYLFNRVRAANGQLLIAAQAHPTLLPLKLPDLGSRLLWGVNYQLPTLADDELAQALQWCAQERGLTLSAEVGQFLIRRCTRSLGELQQLLMQLDAASLIAQRRITIPFVKQTLQL